MICMQTHTHSVRSYAESASMRSALGGLGLLWLPTVLELRLRFYVSPAVTPVCEHFESRGSRLLRSVKCPQNRLILSSYEVMINYNI